MTTARSRRRAAGFAVALLALACASSIACRAIVGLDDLRLDPGCAGCDAGDDATDATDAIDATDATDATETADTIDARDAIDAQDVSDAAGEVDGAPPPVGDRAWPMPHGRGTGAPAAKYRTAGVFVFDEITGLEWMRDATVTASWSEAEAECRKPRDGHVDWRLPSVLESASIVDPGVAGAALIDVTVFTSDPSGWFWSREAVVGEPGARWAVTALESDAPSTLGALSDPRPESDALRVRCVRTDSVKSAAGPRFETTLDAVIDHDTRLEWERAPSPTTAVFEDRAARCAAKGSGHRVPTLKELTTIVDLSRRDPAIVPDLAGGTLYLGELRYGSSTREAADGGAPLDWGMRFDRGHVFVWLNGSSYDPVRCVRSLP